jgi:hypothetical protein
LKEHRYEDRFEAAERFQWQSQNKQQRGGTTEQKLARHVEFGIPVHLFVRKAPKVDGRAAYSLTDGIRRLSRAKGLSEEKAIADFKAARQARRRR